MKPSFFAFDFPVSREANIPVRRQVSASEGKHWFFARAMPPEGFL